MDKLPEKHKLQHTKLTQEEIDNMNITVSIKEIEFVVKTLPTRKF